MPDFPAWTYSTITVSNFLSAGIVTDMMVQLSLAQTRFKEAAFSFSTLASFIKIGQSSQGFVEGLAHSAIGGVTSNQHHQQLHGSGHAVAGSDILLYASANRAGIVSAVAASKLATIESSATRHDFKVSKYTGDGAVSQLISFGWRPISIKLIMGGSGHAYEWSPGASIAVLQSVSSGATDAFNDFHFWVTNAFATHANGFIARGTCNITNVVYFFRALRATN